MTDQIEIVLLGHRGRTGKDTLANYLVKDGFIRYAFADRLKEVVADLYNFSDEQMFGSLKDVEDKRYPNKVDKEYLSGGLLRCRKPNPDYKEFLTPRRILQIFGQQQRAFYSDVWASYVFNNSVEFAIAAGNTKFVIPDFRFPNEYAVAKRWCDKVPGRKLSAIKIDRPDLAPISGMNDISETALLDFKLWDRVIVNDKTPDDLYSSYLNDVEREFDRLQHPAHQPKVFQCGECVNINNPTCSVMGGCEDKILL